MTTTQLTIFDQGQMPAHLADLGDTPNVVGRDKTNQLSFRGKVWRVAVEGKEDIVKNGEGDPVQSVNIVILDYTKTRARAYFADKYVEGKKQAPSCWSADSKTPDKEVPADKRQSTSCGNCPKAAKGSSDSETGKGAACPQFRRAVVVPLADPSFTPLLLKIPQTSLWDKDNKENEGKAFYAFDQFMDMLKSKGVEHTARVVAKVKFDERNAYPKLLFNPAKWTPAEAVPLLKANMDANKEEIAKILAGAYDTTAIVETDPEPEQFEQADTSEAAAAAAKEAQEATAKAAEAAKAARKPPAGRPAAKKTEPAPVAAAAPAPAAAEPVVIEATAKVVEEAAEPAVAEAPAAASGLGSLLNSWDD
jgi:hypothetical protein